MADTTPVNGYTLNNPGRPAPWADTEYQLFSDIVGYLPTKGSYLTTQHLHSVLSDPGEDTAAGTTMVEVVDENSIKLSGGGLKTAHLNTTGLCIDMTGTFNVGNPTEILDLRNTAANMYLKLYTGNTRTCGIKFGDTDDDDVGKIEYNHSTNTHTITANTLPCLSVTSGGVTGETNVRNNLTIVDAIGGNDVVTMQAGRHTFNKYSYQKAMANAESWDFFALALATNNALLLFLTFKLVAPSTAIHLYSQLVGITYEPNAGTWQNTSITPAPGAAYAGYVAVSINAFNIRIATNMPAGWSANATVSIVDALYAP